MGRFRLSVGVLRRFLYEEQLNRLTGFEMEQGVYAETAVGNATFRDDKMKEENDGVLEWIRLVV